MNQNKFYFEAGSFTDARGANDLYGNALRSALSFDAYGNNQQFDVVVLTAPVPLAGADAGLVIGQSNIEASANEGQGTVGSFAFKGRIVNGGVMSPHLTLPDPCNLSLATNVGSALKIINLHTTFMSSAGYTGPIPSVGETVKVSLQPGDFKFNMQYATFDKLMSAGDGNAVSHNMGDGCVTLAGRFENFDIEKDLGDVNAAYADRSEEGPSGAGITYAAVADYIEAIKPQIEERLGFTLLKPGECGIPSDFPGISDEIKALYPVTKCVSAVIGKSSSGDGTKEQTTTGHPVWIKTLKEIHADAQKQDWWKRLTEKNGVEPILYSSGFRSIETQIYLRMKKCRASNVETIMMSGNSSCSPPVAPPGYSRHNLGLAIDYGGILGKTLSNEASQWLRSKQRNTAPDGGDGSYFIKRYSAEEWHYSIDGK